MELLFGFCLKVDRKSITISVLFPPLNEQRRIVDKLDRIGDRQRSARNELNHIPKLIARYKQAVLAAACSGKLTEDWREKNPNVEPVSVLVMNTQIESEKRNWTLTSIGQVAECLDKK